MSIFKKIVFGITLFSCSHLTVAHGRTHHSPGEPDIEKSMVTNGLTRSMLIHLPERFQPENLYALVVVLHGGKGSAEGARRMSEMNQKADQEGFIVVYPNGTGKRQKRFLLWNDGYQPAILFENPVDDVAFFRQLLAMLKADYPIDSRRIFITGLSNGAFMAYRLACEMSEDIAAIAPVAGSMVPSSCQPRSPVSIVLFHGTSDSYVPYSGGLGRSAHGQRRQDISVKEVTDFWVKHNGCDSVTLDKITDRVQRQEFSECAEGASVVAYTLVGGGHSWPGGKRGIWNGNVDPPSPDISATNLMWEFFKQHPKP